MRWGWLLAAGSQAAAPFTQFATINKRSNLRRLNLDWAERDLPQRERTKHVHRLHPYLGKFVPQLAEIFLRKYRPQRVCDPFAGSGTTLVEAMALGVDSVGIDISAFNCLLMRVKTSTYDLVGLRRETDRILDSTESILKARKARIRSWIDESPEARLIVSNQYLREWYDPGALSELLAFQSQIPTTKHREFFRIVLSRAARSARLAKHSDLDFPTKPQMTKYYCHKHDRTCYPTTAGLQFVKSYARNNLARVEGFDRIRRSAEASVLNADSRFAKVPEHELLLTSPPYVGLIDYHEQHRYAYELLHLQDRSDDEIGPAKRGTSTKASDAYVSDIVAVLRNTTRSLAPDGKMVIVVADKRDLYNEIREELGARELQRLERHVNRRTGRRASEFTESVLVWDLP